MVDNSTWVVNSKTLVANSIVWVVNRDTEVVNKGTWAASNTGIHKKGRAFVE